MGLLHAEEFFEKAAVIGRRCGDGRDAFLLGDFAAGVGGLLEFWDGRRAACHFHIRARAMGAGVFLGDVDFVGVLVVDGGRWRRKDGELWAGVKGGEFDFVGALLHGDAFVRGYVAATGAATLPPCWPPCTATTTTYFGLSYGAKQANHAMLSFLPRSVACAVPVFPATVIGDLRLPAGAAGVVDDFPQAVAHDLDLLLEVKPSERRSPRIFGSSGTAISPVFSSMDGCAIGM